MSTLEKVAIHGASCGLAIGLVLLVGGRVWQPKVVAAQEVQEQVVAKYLVTQNFAVVDGNGKPRILMSVDEDADVIITITDENSVPRVMLGVGEGTPYMGLTDKDGRDRLHIKVSDDPQDPIDRGSPKIWFKDTSGEQRVVLSLFLGEPAIRLYDSSGRAIEICDTNSKAKASFGVGKDGNAELKILGKDYRETIWSAP